MLYLADNSAYFLFQSQDGPLFITYHINTMISVDGQICFRPLGEVSDQ